MFEANPMTAADVMTREVISVPPDATLRQAARLMTQHGISALPVVKGGVVVGIVSETDLLQPGMTPAPQPDWWLHQLAGEVELAPEYMAALRDAGRSVGQIMQPDPVWVPEDAKLSDIAALMAREGVRRVLVLRDGAAVGVVSRRDLVGVFAGKK
jgi:CBS domain-containing protein